MNILGIDVNPEFSALVWYDSSSRTVEHVESEAPNPSVEGLIQMKLEFGDGGFTELVAIEDIEPMGQPLSRGLRTVAQWGGALYHGALPKYGDRVVFIPRSKVKMELCGMTRVGDASVNTRLKDLHSDDPKMAVGTSKHRGPLWGVRNHAWAALAVAYVAGRDSNTWRRM